MALGLSFIGFAYIVLHVSGIALLPVIVDSVSWETNRLSATSPGVIVITGLFLASVGLAFLRPYFAGFLMIAAGALCMTNVTILLPGIFFIAGGVLLILSTPSRVRE